MKRDICGLVQAGRVWQQHLMTWMIGKLHAWLYLNDRCAFEWSHTYADAAGEQVTERLIGIIHVGDVLFTVEGEHVPGLSRFTNSPRPGHFAAAKNVLRYLKGSPGAGVTYHGSDERCSTRATTTGARSS